MQFDDIPESDISMDEDWPTLSSATIDCPTSSEPAPIGRASQASPNERQRPTRIANRPPRYRDISFDTHFQPVPRRRCRKIQKPSSTRHNDINAEVRHELGRGVNHKNVASTGNENARQKPPFRLGTSCRSRFIASFHPDSSRDLLATSRSLNNKRRRYLREDKEIIKFTTLPYPLMNAKNEESSIETSSTHQKRSRTAHLQRKSITRSRASTDRRFAVPRGSETAGIVISTPLPAARHRAQASSADTRSITTATVRDRQAAVSNNKSTSVSVDREMQSVDNSSPEISVHLEPYKFHLQHQYPQLNTADVQTSLKAAISAIKCRVADDAYPEKIKIAETTASAITGVKKVHKHRFRRKKRQKAKETAKGN